MKNYVETFLLCRRPGMSIKAAVIAALLIGAAPQVYAAPITKSSVSRVQSIIADAKTTMLTDPRAAVAKAQSAAGFAHQIKNRHEREMMIATADWLQGEALIRLNMIDSAEPLIDNALVAVRQRSPVSKLHGDLLLSAGGVATEKGRVADALSDYQQAFEVFRKIVDTRSQAKALIQIASLYAWGKDQASALKYFQQALDIHNADLGLSVAILNGQGNAFKEIGNYQLAEDKFSKALRAAEDFKSTLLVATILRNLANAQLLGGNVNSAKRTIDRALAVASAAEAAPARPTVLVVAAQVALNRNELRTARSLIEQRFANLAVDKTTLADRDAHEAAYEIYRRSGMDALALQHLAALKRLDDQATKLATSTNTALMAARFDFANQELKIAKLRQAELQRNVAFEKARARTQRLIFYGAAGATAIVIALLGVGLVTIRRSRNEVRAANDDLAVTNTALGKALAAKTEFLATTSHEIRTPLNGILGMAQVMLADGSLDEGTRDRLKVVHGAGVTMRALVDDILDVAKMETGNLTIEQAPFDLRATIQEATRLWEAQASAKGLAFARRLDDCPTTIEGDAARVRQIVFNLLSNALKFTAAGEVTLAIAPSADGQRYAIVVTDTGVGIPADKQEEIFESFRQADTSTTRQFGGTGLGLSICRNLAEAMGGTITVASEVGRGSTFTVELPLVRVDMPDAAVETQSGARLLIVDRNPIARNMLKAVLAPHVDEVAFDGSAVTAVETVREGMVSQVLVDATSLADEDRGAPLAALAAACHDARVPATLLWAAADEAGAAALRQVGWTRIVLKPVAGSALAAAMFGDSSSPNAEAPLVSLAA